VFRNSLRRFLPHALVVPLALWQTACAAADGQTFQSAHHQYRVEVLFEGLEHPWALAFLPDGRMLVTERPGRLNLLDPRDGSRRRIAGVPEVAAVSQGGLLDVALHPKFQENNWVYLSYSARRDRGLATHVGRGRLVGDRLEDFRVLFRAEPALSRGQHFGSRLVFDRQGWLFFTVGDHGERDSAQDRGTHMGTVIRLTDDGRVPPDNPFVKEPGARPEIYSYGHRNPQGMTLHPRTGALWLHEHGPRGGDEINLPKPGLNYGWPKVTFGREYFGPTIGPEPPQPGFESPIHHWTPSIAPSGMAFYDGDKFPRWRGDLFVGALTHRHLQRLRLDGEKVVEQEPLLSDLKWRIRDVRSGPDGYLYVLPDDGDAKLIRLVPAD
jgi:glucose/arabinose dehydrogenase